MAGHRPDGTTCTPLKPLTLFFWRHLLALFCACVARRRLSQTIVRRIAVGPCARLVFLRRHDAADHDHDVGAALAVELGLELRNEREGTGGERRHADNVHVVLDRLARGFGRRRKQRTDVDVETEIGERRGDNLISKPGLLEKPPSLPLHICAETHGLAGTGDNGMALSREDDRDNHQALDCFGGTQDQR